MSGGFARVWLWLACGAIAVALACLGVWTLARTACGGGGYGGGGYDDSPLELRTLSGFLTPEECDAVVEAARAKGMQRSTVVSTEGASSTRTSSTTFLGADESPVVGRVFAKVAAMLGASEDRFEKMQVIAYQENQQYKAHYDPCFKCANGTDLPREFTVLVYLNDGFEGGTTDFPLADPQASVVPEQGMALVFRNMKNGKIVRASKHQGSPVSRGTKWAATVWVRSVAA